MQRAYKPPYPTLCHDHRYKKWLRTMDGVILDTVIHACTTSALRQSTEWLVGRVLLLPPLLIRDVARLVVLRSVLGQERDMWSGRLVRGGRLRRQ